MFFPWNSCDTSKFLKHPEQNPWNATIQHPGPSVYPEAVVQHSAWDAFGIRWD